MLFALAEWLFPAQRRPWTRDSWLSATYLLFTGKLSFFAIVLVPIFRHGWLGLGLPSLHLDQRLPLWLYAPFAVLVVTFTAYWAHHGMDRIPPLWHIHKIHHSASNLGWTAVFHRHSLEFFLHTPLHLTALMLLGTDLVAPFGIVFQFIDLLGHSNVGVNLGRLGYFLSTPRAHRVHHSILPQHFDRNFGNTIMLWDHVFGTFHYEAVSPRRFGIDQPIPKSFVKQQLLPFAWIARDVRAKFARRAAPAPPGSPGPGD